MKKITITTFISLFTFLCLNACSFMEITGNNTFQEDTNFHEERITRGTYTVHSIKEMIHHAVLEHPNYTFDEENDRYVYGYEGEGYREFYSRKNINRMVELILDLGLDRKIDTNQLGPIAKQYLTTFLGRNKGIYHHDMHFWRRWYPSEGRYYVPYNFAGEWTTPQRRIIIRNAMNVIEQNTRIRFIDQKNPKWWIFWGHLYIYESSDGNSSYLGNSATLRIENFTQGVIIHELMHALGVIHEHQRDDRHNHVLNLPNRNFRDDFDKREIDVNIKTVRTDGCGTKIETGKRYGYNHRGYDLASIMHYSTSVFNNLFPRYVGDGVRYVKDRPDVHVKQARFKYNVTDRLPIIDSATFNDRLNDASMGDFPNRIINNTLTNNTIIGGLLSNIDRNQLCYGANTTAIVETNMLYTNIDRVLPYPQYFSNNAPSGSLGTKRFFDGRNWTIVSNIVAGHLLFSKVFRVTWATFGDKITTHILSSNVISNQSHIPSSVISSAYLATDDQKVAFLLAIHSGSDTISNFTPQHFLNTMRAEITNINSNIVWNVADAVNPTQTELNQYNNSVHGKNYRLIYDYILSRFEGSGNFNLNSRLEYFWTAPVIENGRVVYTHFLSDGDISVLRRISGL